MKKRLSVFILFCIIVFNFTSCELNISNILATLPAYLTQTLYINYDSTLGTAVVNSEGIDVIQGSNKSHEDLIFYQRATEFDTSTLNENGYTITTTYTQEEIDSEYPSVIEALLTYVCEKEGSDTLKFEFGIYYNGDSESKGDIAVHKYINNIIVEEWETYLTWDEG